MIKQCEIYMVSLYLVEPINLSDLYKIRSMMPKHSISNLQTFIIEIECSFMNKELAQKAEQELRKVCSDLGIDTW